jgi:UTP--glucose-1-phosphate uridylyltransferase
LYPQVKEAADFMRKHGLPFASIRAFASMMAEVVDGKEAYVPLDSCSPPHQGLLIDLINDSKAVEAFSQRGAGLLSKVIVIKLNGGRSTTMGGEVPKGILKAKNGFSYLDIIINQMEAIRRRRNIRIPLVLMNSFFTKTLTGDLLRTRNTSVLTFEQNKVPRLEAETLFPLDTDTLEDWAPAGHGDVFLSLQLSGLLDRFLSEGYRWAFISNIDNLAACLEPWILGLIEDQSAEFLMEVTERTTADRKGGTLVFRDGRLFLLEIAQVAPQAQETFMDLDLFPVFNTNNIWVDLGAVKKVLGADQLRLPVIQNRKTVMGHSVLQLETAMGAAISAFEKAIGLKVTRDRFFPTKTVEDLFVLQSDVCILDELFRLRKNPRRPTSLPLRPMVSFSYDFLRSPLNFPDRFEDPEAVSLVGARGLHVEGQVFFERDVRVEGSVTVRGRSRNGVRIPQGTTLKDTIVTG